MSFIKTERRKRQAANIQPENITCGETGNIMQNPNYDGERTGETDGNGE